MMMRREVPPRLALLAWLVVLGAGAPLVVVEADAGGCDRIQGVDGSWSRCVDAERTFSYRAIGLKVEEQRTVDDGPSKGTAWTSLWFERSGPLSATMAVAGATAVVAALLFPPLYHRSRRRPETRAATVAWWAMAAALALFLLAAVAHARLNGADRGWPSWGMAFPLGALASGWPLWGLRRQQTGGPMPSLPTFG